MKKSIITFLLLFVFLTLTAPPTTKCLYLPTVSIINTWIKYEQLVKAVVKIESNGNTLAFNVSENAVGAFQIRPCRIKHYNKLNNTNYKHKDCYDYDLSEKIFLFFAEGKDYEQAAKNWNGSGPMTEIYWKKVKQQINLDHGYV